MATPIKVRTVRQDQVVGTQTINELFQNDAILDAAISALAGQVGDVGANLSGLDGRIAAAEGTVSALAVDVAQAKADATSAKTTATTAQTTASAAQAAAVLATGYVGSLTPRVETAETRLSNHEERLVGLEGQARDGATVSASIAYSSTYSIEKSQGVQSIARVSTGRVLVTFTAAFADKYYVGLVTAKDVKPVIGSVSPEDGGKATICLWNYDGTPIDCAFSVAVWRP